MNHAQSLQAQHSSLSKAYAIVHSHYVPQDSTNQDLFYEIVDRCITDVVSLKESEPHEKPLTKLIAQLQKFTGNTAGVVQLILNNLDTFSKGYVQTPHPTEVLPEEAIAAEGKLMEALEQIPELKDLSKPSLKTVERPKLEALTQALKALDNALGEKANKLTIEDEMKRSVRFSERMFDAVPLIANEVLENLNIKSTALNKETLPKFFHLLQPETWSPGDRDSKPDMTAKRLQEGITLSKRAMFKHYFRHMAIIGSKIDDVDVQKSLFPIMERAIATAFQERNGSGGEYNAEYIKKTLDETPESAAVSNTAFINNFLAQFSADADKYYQSNGEKTTGEQFVEELFSIRETCNKNYPLIKEDAHISPIDMLIIQAGNFGIGALKPQIRENNSVHSGVLSSLAPFIAEHIEGVTAESIHERAVLDQVIDKIYTDESFRSALRNHIQVRFEEIEAAGHHERQEGEIKNKEDYYFYQTLKGLELAATNPVSIPHYLVAECASPEHLLEAFALLSMMEDSLNPRHKVDIVPLVEYPEQVLEHNEQIDYSRIVTSAYENPHFSKHHRDLSKNSPALKDYSLSKGKTDLTVAEVKRQFHLTLHEGDEEKIIRSTKLAMGAGSDVTKAGGVAAAIVMQHATERLREDLLNMKDPVLLIDYVGVGGGLHRSQPTATAKETVQGRSMRQSPYYVCAKTVGRLVNHLFNKLAFDLPGSDYIKNQLAEIYLDTPDNTLRKNLKGTELATAAQLNLGNLLNLSVNEKIWQEHTGPRAERWIKKYQNDLYKNPDFEDYFSYTANVFVPLVSLAARPMGRIGAKADEGFPPKVEVSTLRAIGYGAALNASGTCASYYHGASQFLNIDSKQLKNIYLGDPKAQDAINRATYGVIMADLNTAWSYLGHKEIPSAEKLTSMITEEPSSQKDKAEKVLAKITVEYNYVSRKLLELHSDISKMRNPTAKPQGEDNAEKILSLLPMALRDQLEQSRARIKPAREKLVDLFNTLVETPDKNARESLLSRDSDTYKNTIYPAMGTIMEFFEHAPRAYTTPGWALKMEQSPQLGMAA